MRHTRTLSASLTRIRKHNAAREDADVALKIELKPNERVILGDCVVTNTDQRTRLVIEGTFRSCAKRTS